MERRNCCEIIRKMIKHTPKEKESLIADLEWNYEDASFKAPEETIQWTRTMQTLMKHIPTPTEKWEFEILSLFTTRPVEMIMLDFIKS
jgi:hypothetical protein